MSVTIPARDSLVCAIEIHGEWPARIGEFVRGLADWLAAHPSTVESADEIESYLAGVLAGQFVIHETSFGPVDPASAGGAEYAFKGTISAVTFDDLRRTVTLAAFERYGPDHATE